MVFGVFGSTISNGGVAVDQVYTYSDLRLGKNGSITIRKNNRIFDSVTYTESTFGYTPGESLSLGTLDATANDTGSNWCAPVATYGDGDLGSPGSANPSCPVYTSVNSLFAGDLVISEVMVDTASTADYRGEWFEIYNNTANEINLNGLSIACGGNTGFTISSNTTIAAGEEFLFAVRSNAASNGGMSNVDYAYSYSACAFGYTDSIALENTSITIDSVSWTTDFSFDTGVSMTLGTLDASLNDSSGYWCAGTSTYGLGDAGTPGAANDTCPEPALSVDTLGAGDLVISEIMSNPTQVADYRGEWFEIYNTSGFDINLNGLDVSSAGNTGFTVDQNVVLNNGEYALFAVNPNSSRNGGISNIDFTYAYADLGFSRQDDITLSVSGTTIDTVSITSSHPDGVGTSLSLGTLNASANDSVSSWCESISTYGLGDAGTPGSANDSCP